MLWWSQSLAQRCRLLRASVSSDRAQIDPSWSPLQRSLTRLLLIDATGVMTSLGFPLYPDGVATGFSMAPTSVGIALKLLGEFNQLNTQCGQGIVTAAFIDDIFSLIASPAHCDKPSLLPMPAIEPLAGIPRLAVLVVTLRRRKGRNFEGRGRHIAVFGGFSGNNRRAR